MSDYFSIIRLHFKPKLFELGVSFLDRWNVADTKLFIILNGKRYWLYNSFQIEQVLKVISECKEINIRLVRY